MLKIFKGNFSSKFEGIYLVLSRGFFMAGHQFTTIREGRAEVLFPNTNEVFYNPVQEFNRDLSVAVIRLFGKKLLEKRGIKVSYDPSAKVQDDSVAESEGNTAQIGQKCKGGMKILEALSASGLRSLRYAKEIAGVEQIIANDLSAHAVANIKRNVEHNQMGNIVQPSESDASLLMYQHRGHFDNTFDVVDLDPYGSAGVFIDPAVQAVRSGGLLCVTCTDMAVLCGNYGETSYAKYGGYAVRTDYSHEMALRLVLQCIETSAVRYGRYIEPLLALSVDFYVRLFVRVHISQGQTKHSASKLAIAYICSGCESFHIQRLGRVTTKENGSAKFSPGQGPPTSEVCSNCGNKFLVAGPLWANPVHDVTFLKELIDHVTTNAQDFNTSERLQGMLTVASEEIPDGPFYYRISKFCNIIHCTSPSQVKFNSALLHAGYRISSTHACREGVKTNAPSSVVWDVLRAWEKLNPVKREKLHKNGPAIAILSKEPSIEVSFEPHKDAKPPSKKLNLKRFQMNPLPNWGPKSRATAGLNETLEKKKKRLQGKRKKQKRMIEADSSENKEPDSKSVKVEGNSELVEMEDESTSLQLEES